MTFEERLLALMYEQMSKPDEYVNPHILSAFHSAVSETKLYVELSGPEQNKIDQFCQDMWGY